MDPVTDAELRARLVRYLDSLEGAARAGGDAVTTQLPEVAREFVRYQIASNILGLAVAAVVLGLCLWAWRRVRRHWESLEVAAEPLCLMIFVPAALAVLLIILCLNTLIEAVLAPKWFALEHFLKAAQGK